MGLRTTIVVGIILIGMLPIRIQKKGLEKRSGWFGRVCIESGGGVGDL